MFIYLWTREKCWLWAKIGQLPWSQRYIYFLSMFSAINPLFLISIFLCCLAPFITVFSCIAEDSFSQPYLKHGRPVACWCNATARSGPLGFISNQHHRSSPNRIATIPTDINTNCGATSLSLNLNTFSTSSPSHSNWGHYQFCTWEVSWWECDNGAKSSRCSSSNSRASHIFPTLVPSNEIPTTSSTSSDPSIRSTSCPIVVVPELAISAEVYPECINIPGGGKDYLHCLCSFRHSNLDCTLIHVRKHLDIIIGCPGCDKGYPNVASLCKHDREVHHI